MTTIQSRRGTLFQWNAANPVLASGEVGFETDSGKHKIGDGTRVWSALPYFLDETGLSDSFARRGAGFLPEALGGLQAWDDFHRPNLATLHGDPNVPSGHIPRVTHFTADHPLIDNTYAPASAAHTAAILFYDHTSDFNTITGEFFWLNDGTTQGHNPVIGTCAKFFGTNGYGGSIQLAVWPEPFSHVPRIKVADAAAVGVTIGSDIVFNPVMTQWLGFAVEDPVSDPYCDLWDDLATWLSGSRDINSPPSGAYGLFYNGFQFEQDGATLYSMRMHRVGDSTVTITLPDGQTKSYLSTHVKRWGRSAGFQSRRDVTTDGHIRFTRIATAATPDNGRVSRLPPLDGGRKLYLPGDSSSSAQVASSVTIAGDFSAIWVGTPELIDRDEILMSQWTSSWKGWFFSKTSSGAGKLRFEYSTDGTGTSVVNSTSTVDIGASAGVRVALRVDRNATTGDIKFWKASPTDSDLAAAATVKDLLTAVTWTQIGTTVSTTPGAIVAASRAALVVGQSIASTPYTGYVDAVAVLDGGVEQAGFNFTHPWEGYGELGERWSFKGNGWRWLLASDSVAPSPNSLPPGYSGPAMNSLSGAPFDPVFATVNTAPFAAGVLYVVRCKVAVAGPLGHVVIPITAVPSAATSGQCFAAIFDSSGNQLGVSADVSAIIGTTGDKSMALSVATASVPIGTEVYSAFLFNGTVGSFTIRGATASGKGNILLTSGFRFATGGSGLTSMPSTLPTLSASVIHAFMAVAP